MFFFFNGSVQTSSSYSNNKNVDNMTMYLTVNAYQDPTFIIYVYLGIKIICYGLTKCMIFVYVFVIYHCRRHDSISVLHIIKVNRENEINFVVHMISFIWYNVLVTKYVRPK